MKQLMLLALLPAFFLTANTSFAQVTTWEVDKAHSSIYFSIDHIYSKVRGHFDDYSATIRFDPDNLEKSSFLFEIQVDSINTNITKRDKHLLSEDFFNEPEYPLIRFQSSAITAAADDTYNVAGTLTIKGQKHDLVLPLKLAGVTDHPMVEGATVAGFNGSITIDRLAYGVGSGKFHQAGVVGKDTDILVSLEVLDK
ncbi:MAG: YceI family protein [Desulfopila sp.]